MARICDLLATLPLEARKRVTNYMLQRCETLPTIMAVNGATADDNGGLFDQACDAAPAAV